MIALFDRASHKAETHSFPLPPAFRFSASHADPSSSLGRVALITRLDASRAHLTTVTGEMMRALLEETKSGWLNATDSSQPLLLPPPPSSPSPDDLEAR